MTAVADAPDFTSGLEDLQDHLPSWWRRDDPSSQLYLMLVALGELLDQLSVLWEQPHLDQVLATASETGLLRNFVFAWGLEQERLPTVAPQLAAYIQQRAAEDGSLQSLIRTLTALIGPQAGGGAVLTFPAGGGGLTFPADGSGLIMYEFAPGDEPEFALVFPADGSGLTFPADGSGLTFTTFTFINVLPSYATSTMTIQVLNYLAFDRGAFARAVARFRDAAWLPTVIQEVTSF